MYKLQFWLIKIRTIESVMNESNFTLLPIRTQCDYYDTNGYNSLKKNGNNFFDKLALSQCYDATSHVKINKNIIK